MSRYRLARRKRAFTWIEILVAVFIVSLSAITMVALLPMSAKTQGMVGDYNQGASLIQHKIDQLRAVGYGRLNYTELYNAGIIDSTSKTSPFIFATVDDLDTLFPNASGTLAITDVKGPNNEVMRQVIVTVVWSGSSMRQGNGTLTTTAYVAKT
jgi:type II secretory pathway pseudopilin PulG